MNHDSELTLQASELETAAQDSAPLEHARQPSSWWRWRPTPDETLVRELLPEHRPEYC